MGKYKNVYSFNVFDEIEAGKQVYVLDREFATVNHVNTMATATAVKLIAQAKDNFDRYEFWYVEEQEDKGND